MRPGPITGMAPPARTVPAVPASDPTTHALAAQAALGQRLRLDGRRRAGSVSVLYGAGATAIRVTRIGADDPARLQAVHERLEGLARVAPILAPVGPLQVTAGYAITLWPWVEPVRPPNGADLGACLRALHAAVPPPGLPQWTAFRTTVGRLAGLSDHPMLGSTATALRLLANELVAALVPDDTWRVVHGDAISDNLVITASGAALVDLDNLGIGPPMLDLGPAQCRHELDKTSPAEAEDMAAAYGAPLNAGPFVAFQRLSEAAYYLTAGAHRPGASAAVRHHLRALGLPTPWRAGL